MDIDFDEGTVSIFIMVFTKFYRWNSRKTNWERVDDIPIGMGIRLTNSLLETATVRNILK